MATNPKHYERITDEYYALFESFKKSGFNDEQAFELVSAYCTSANIANMMTAIVHEKSSRNYEVLSKYARKSNKTSEKNTEDPDYEKHRRENSKTY